MKLSNELQIEIDDVYACPGHCPGCLLSSIERKALAPDMSNDILFKSIEKLKDYHKTLMGLEKINLTYGVGDHFLMDINYLLKTYNLGADLIESAKPKNIHSGVFYTASLIGRTQLLKSKMLRLNEESILRGVPVYIIAVIDPKHLMNTNFSSVYESNISLANSIFKKVDLSLNLSEAAIDNITPQQLFNFAKKMGFDEITINWVPTKDNIQHVYFDQSKLLNWLIEFDGLIAGDNSMTTSFRPVLLKVIDNLMCKTVGVKNNLKDDVTEQLKELVGKSIHIDHLGNVFPKYEAIGDVSHSPRLGYKPLGNVVDSNSLFNIINENEKHIKLNVLKQFTKGLCVTCKYNNFCANTGFHIYNKILEENAPLQVKENIDKNKCYHIAKGMFDYYLNKEFK